MPGGSANATGNEQFDMLIYLVTVTVPNVNTQVSANQTVTVNGVQTGDYISWNAQTTGTSGLFVTNVYVSAANTLTFTWFNGTTGNLTSNAAQAFVLEVVRGTNAALGLAALGSAIE